MLSNEAIRLPKYRDLIDSVCEQLEDQQTSIALLDVHDFLAPRGERQLEAIDKEAVSLPL